MALEIIELVDIVPNSQFSAVRGQYDIDMVGTGIGSIGEGKVSSGGQDQNTLENQQKNTGMIKDDIEFRETTFPASGS